ncbi:a-pheromone processing metallopeptidase Ste23 [Akanthomyces lecanii RCEF 1005]|uniref:A-pheromone processing metallopeptidase Ste23 n=1 Tax=Akanthomyces lecanii RCEF 1005 TaxID=1081108 RepID=A0A162JWC8_CORDF|nr:a-pheromone processing metallopeptidase Ste23 [Akanthomyces lecanii RCEF 1005]
MAPSAVPDRASALGRQASVTLLTDRLEKPSLDDRQYRVVRLENGLEALLVHDPETDKASAALDVNVGSFSDEDGMPGMAHAVEHLLFMGTKKFPVENEYSQYLSSNGGSSNAYTAGTSTNYYFDIDAKPANEEEPTEINPSPLLGALDRFAQFFIEPLFLSTTLDRELKAVDSENKKNLQSDAWRLQQLDKSLSNPKHPYCHFSTGNFEVLKTLPESQGINVRDKFIEFHAKHYSANRMKLVILGRESLDVLQKWTVQLFSAVVNKSLPQNRWSDEVPFTPSDIGIQWFAKPVMDTRELNLTFPFIDEEELYESQPSRYISHLIGHEGPGSIMSYIKSKGWANGLSAGGYSLCPGTPGIFDVQIRLTEEGLKNYTEIAKIFFQYVSLLRQSPPQEWIFQEQKGMTDVNFKFRQKTPASRFTSKVSSVMQKPLPREWLLSGHSRLRRFDAGLITKCLDLLRPEALRLNVVSRNFPGKWDKKEKWYGTEYTAGRIPDDLMTELKKAASISAAERLSELHLPHKNQFIPNKLEVEKKEVAEAATSPRLLRNDQLARTWWKKDDTFWVPKANVTVSLKNPIIHATAENSVKARLFAELVRDALEEYSYDAELAGLQYTVSIDSRGLFLDVSGYNDKLPVLLEQVAVTMRDIEIKADRFDIVKERLTRGYDNWQLQSSYQQVGDYMTWLHAECDYVVEEAAAELPAITIDAVRSFQKQMLAQLYIEVYVHGNMYKGDAIKVTDLLVSSFRSRILPPNQWPIIRSLIIPPGSNLVYHKTLKDPANVNHCIETTFYIGDRGDRKTRARSLLADQLIHEPAFDQLRTKEQLGYIVFAGMRSFSTTCGLRFLLQSEREPEYLDRRVEAFLIQFGLTLDKMPDSEFESHKRSLINKRLEKLRNLDQESSRHWAQISKEYYDFEQAQLDAAEVKLVTKAEMIDFYNKHFHPSSNSRARISVHLHARGAVERDSKVVAALEQAGFADVPEQDRKSLDLVKAHLQAKHKPSNADLDSVVASIKELGLVQTAHPEDDAEAVASGGQCAVDTAQEIKDVRLYKSGLLASSGARPVKHLSEFEDTDSKL